MVQALIYVGVFLAGFIIGSLTTENSYLKGRRKKNE